MEFYGIPFMHPYKQSGRWQDMHTLSSTSVHFVWSYDIPVEKKNIYIYISLPHLKPAICSITSVG